MSKFQVRNGPTSRPCDHCSKSVSDHICPSEARPVAWIRTHKCDTHIPGAHEYDEEVHAGEFKPTGEGWEPLYRRAT